MQQSAIALVAGSYPYVRGMFNVPKCLGKPFGLATLLAAPLLPLAHADDEPCIDYYTVGASACQAPQPGEPPLNENNPTPRLLAPQSEPAQADQVDDFLQNYGKPPREFVEFYLNPTADNAQKWVAAYQQIMQKTQNLSQLWSNAEQLYQQGARPQAVVRQPTPAAPPPPSVTASPSAPVARPSTNPNFGGLGAGASQAPSGIRTPVSAPLNVTYYYSQTCPFCARMTPELNAITTSYNGKLAFTCVDVTPYTATTAPNPASIRDKLPCQWRLPQPGELEEQGIKQTPTLLVQKEGQNTMRLSGYMSQAQLATHFGL